MQADKNQKICIIPLQDIFSNQRFIHTAFIHCLPHISGISFFSSTSRITNGIRYDDQVIMKELTDAFIADTKLSDTQLTSFFAKESDDPIVDAFDKKAAVHPGGGKSAPLPPPKAQKAFQSILSQPRQGKSTVYIHIPFCETQCLYCGFYRKRYDAEQSRAYTDTLITELQATADSPLQSQGPIHAVYLGGGTPTSLEAADLKRILCAIRQNLPLANDCEITVEGRIVNFGPKKMEACLEAGANRFSIGVQTFDTALRTRMKRVADQNAVIEGLKQLRSYDQAAVIVDLIYGFPDQTMESWETDLKILADLMIDGVDLYQLNIFPGTPLHTAIKNQKMSPGIDRKARARMFEKGVQFMEQAMFHRLSTNHWGRTSRERNLYNQLVKGPSHCLPFGPGAGGNAHGHFFFLQPDYEKWKHLVTEEKCKPIAMMQVSGENDILEKTIASELELCRINFTALGDEFHLPLEAILKDLYTQWEKAGLVTRQHQWWVLTTAGQFWQVNLAQLTINYLQQITGKH